MSKTHVLSAIFLFALATLCLAAPVEVPQDKPKTEDTALHKAVEKGEVDRETLVKILATGVDINARGRLGMPALHEAMPLTTERLLILGADPDARGEVGMAALHRASPEKGRILVAYGADVNARDSDGDTPLHYQCRLGGDDVQYIRFLIDRGADIHAKNDKGETPLGRAVMSDGPHEPDEELVRLLITRGADVNARWRAVGESAIYADFDAWDTLDRYELLDFFECTPLHRIITGMPEFFPLCVQHGADLDTRDAIGQTLMHYAAASYGSGAVFDYLLEHCGNVNARDNLGATPLHVAAENEMLDNMRRLVEAGADVNARDRFGRPPIFFASWENHDEENCVQYLYENGADLHAVDHRDGTLLHHVAEQIPHGEYVDFLVAHGLDVHARDDAGNTPLHRAAGWGGWLHDTIDFLARHGAEVDARNHEGQTPLHLAASGGFKHKMQCLLDHGAELEAVDNHGRTPMLLFDFWQDGLAKAQVLLDAGADIRVRDHAGRTLLHYAAKGRPNPCRREWLDYLTIAGLDINAQDNAGNTPLHVAAENNPKMVRVLLEYNADPNLRNAAGELPGMPTIENEEWETEDE